MPRTSKWTLWIALGLLLAVPLANGQTHARRKTRKKPVQEFLLPPLPKGPLSQVPMDQIPSVPPQVSYQGGLLTIVAQNATLSEVLRAVHKTTGASIEVPPNASERVVVRLGPAPARDVLASLLNGTSFNYVMLGSAANPAGLSSLVLTAKTGGGPAQATANIYQPPAGPGFTPPERMIMGQPGMGQPGMPRPGQHQAASVEADADDADAEEADADQDQSEDQSDTNGASGQDGAQPGGAPRTPDQILQMMQKQQQQQPGQPTQTDTTNQTPEQ